MDFAGAPFAKEITMNIPPKNERQNVQGNRQGGGDQTGKRNRPAGFIPPADEEQAALADQARQARDPKGRAHSSTLSAAGPTRDE
jgi:hypothetical protein